MEKKYTIFAYGCDDEELTLFPHLCQRYHVDCIALKEPLTKSNYSFAKDCHCISISHKNKVDATLLHSLKQLGITYLSTRSVGCNHIDTDAAKKLGITVMNTPYSPDSVADYTLMLMLMITRNCKNTLHNANSYDFTLCRKRPKELRDCTVGVVGTGRIGQCVINRLTAFGCKILAYDPYPKGNFYDYTSMETLLAKSDIVTLHLPLINDTYHLLNNTTFSLMKEDSYLVNVSRGGLVDSDALLKAVTTGKLSGAALDVVEGEEPFFYQNCSYFASIPEHIKSLLENNNIILTPHTAFYTEHALQDTITNTITTYLEYERRTNKCIS